MVDFVITHLLPGDPIDALVGNYPAPAAYIARVRHDFGLDQGLAAQLGHFLVNLAKGNLGFSFVNRQPVLPLILDRAGTTLIRCTGGDRWIYRRRACRHPITIVPPGCGASLSAARVGAHT
jgi:ABC-type dipeptide/oligopeptide/nickel transport system permease component